MKVFKNILFSSLLLLTNVLLSQNEHHVFLNDTLPLVGHILYEDDFVNDRQWWKAEQQAGGTAVVTDGQLEIEDVAGCTLWFKKKLKQPIMIEYTATVIDEDGPHDRVSDLNCFWLADDPRSGNLLADSSRNGRFSQYDSLRLYYVGLGGHNNTKTRFRRYTGNGEKPLLPEHDLSDARYLITPNVPNRIRIIAYHGIIQYWRNDQLIYDLYDPAPYPTGYFAFRTVNNHMIVDDFRVYGLKETDSVKR